MSSTAKIIIHRTWQIDAERIAEVILHLELPFDNDGQLRGAYESYITKGNYTLSYQEGIILADLEKKCFEYDGACVLPSRVATALVDAGYDVTDIVL
jgi:hypothetical protein